MYLWFVSGEDREWGSYVIESTRGKAKARFYRVMYPWPGDYFRATGSAESAGTDGVPINFERG